MENKEVLAATETEALKAAENERIEADFSANFVPKVHKIGITTHALALITTLLPAAYFMFVKGYMLDSPLPYITLIVAVAPGMLGFWLTEALGYWPMLGSAGVYMTYLAGNSGSMRVPVATAAQNALDAPVTTARGQVVTIIAIATSVVFNLFLLLLIILFGDLFVKAIPPAVKGAFAFVSVSVFATVFTMRLTSTGKFKDGMVKYWPYLLIGVGVFILKKYIVPAVSAWAPLIAVILSVVLGYFLFKRDEKKKAQEGAKA